MGVRLTEGVNPMLTPIKDSLMQARCQEKAPTDPATCSQWGLGW